MAFDFDLFVIGAGSGGVRAARIAAENGAKVAVAEEYRVGGTCVIRGCIPKKLLVYASHFAEDLEDAAAYGWTVPAASFDWGTLIRAKDKEIDRLEGIYRTNLEKSHVRLFQGRASLVDGNTVQVGGVKFTADTILIATGGRPFVPEFPGCEHTITSNEVFHLKELPKRVLVSGAGYIAVEFAGIFHGLGSEVTQVYRRDKVLRGFDEDLRDRLTAAMEARGISFMFHTVIASIEKADGGLDVTFSNGETKQFDCVMCALGRLPNTSGIGLAEAGVALADNGAVRVDAYSKSSVDNIYAVGDVTDRINLTPVAIKEGHAFALTKYAGLKTSPEHDNVASAVFSQPPIATVGLSEGEATDKGLDFDVYTSEFRPLKQTLTERVEKTFVKMLVEKESDVVIGIHIIGPDAAEIVQGAAIAVKNGLTKKAFDSTVAIHPTTAEELVLLRTKR